MRFSRQTAARFAKFVAVGALVGIVFSILFIALPLAGVLFLLTALDAGWTLPWAPSMPVIMTIGALGGAVFAGVLFVKDQFVPYVEDVPDFEADNDDIPTDRFDR